MNYLIDKSLSVNILSSAYCFLLHNTLIDFIHKDITTTYNTYGDVFNKFEFDNISKAEDYMRQNGLVIYT